MAFAILTTGSVHGEKTCPMKSGEKRSKDTWQSNTGYLAIYPWIHCKVSLDTFSGQFLAENRAVPCGRLKNFLLKAEKRLAEDGKVSC